MTPPRCWRSMTWRRYGNSTRSGCSSAMAYRIRVRCRRRTGRRGRRVAAAAPARGSWRCGRAGRRGRWRGRSRADAPCAAPGRPTVPAADATVPLAAPPPAISGTSTPRRRRCRGPGRAGSTPVRPRPTLRSLPVAGHVWRTCPVRHVCGAQRTQRVLRAGFAGPAGDARRAGHTRLVGCPCRTRRTRPGRRARRRCHARRARDAGLAVRTCGACHVVRPPCSAPGVSRRCRCAAAIATPSPSPGRGRTGGRPGCLRGR